MAEQTEARRLGVEVERRGENCGIDGAVIVDEVSQKGANIGYDANNAEYVDMFKAGIIDPLKVVRSALGNAASISAQRSGRCSSTLAPNEKCGPS